ncbi:MAG TPA: methyltransferase domain-containing protein [Candidatus Dormibacteraeota bacterium]|nr:methyltransferase domain-containing protein [Candidatus Dormibacteraeota bacterium]
MIWLGLVLIILAVCFGGVLLFGAPYLPTLKPQILAALELADLKPGNTLLELGCGDGRVLLAAAKRGYNAVGYELNPLLAAIAWLRTRRYRRQVRVVWGDFWRADWPPAEVVFTFLLTKYMPKLDKKVMRYAHKPVKLVSYAFTIPGKPPAAAKNGVYLYRYER